MLWSLRKTIFSHFFRFSYFRCLQVRDDSNAGVHRQFLPGPPVERHPLARRRNADSSSDHLLVLALHLCLPGPERHHGKGLERRRSPLRPAGPDLQHGLDHRIPVGQRHHDQDSTTLSLKAITVNTLCFIDLKISFRSSCNPEVCCFKGPCS